MKLFMIFSMLISLPVQLSVVRYNYSYYGEVIHSAPGMNFATYFNGNTVGTTFSSPEDIVVFDDIIYMIDSGNNSLFLIDSDFGLISQHASFPINAEYQERLEEAGQTEFLDITLESPYGLEVKDSAIYIADSGNFRIVKLNHNFEVIDIFSDINDATFDEINFEPRKITVDGSERMYVVARNVYEGILELDTDGDFNRFTGVNPVSLNPIEIFQRSIMTEEQLSQLQLYLPTEYTNVVMNDKNFIYATSKPAEDNAENIIQLINPKGVDVLKRNGYHPPMGDIQYIEGLNNYVIEGPSSLVDIAYTDDGIFTVLDQKRSRLFTYDSEGNLLYINGDDGAQADKFSEGVSLAYLNDNLLVLDRKARSVIVYQLTNFGAKVNEAIKYHTNGEFELASEVWEEVLILNTNYEIAYNGIGKYYLREGLYKEALTYFNLGHDKYYYSKAYKAYRNEILKSNFGYILGGIVLIAGTVIGLKIKSTYKKGGSIFYED
ncbi:MAG: hypothetical protein K8Q99_07390 [Acholeplasmataceae bacterium]|nr:hypothetical protein [Acholeplasmataceae bacterium]